MWGREWNIKMRSWIIVYIIVEKSLFGDINMEVDIWKKWISLRKKYISFVRWKSLVVVGRVWARPLESCGLRAPLLHQAGSSSSGVMVGHRPLWTKRRGWGEVRKSRRIRVSPKKYLSDKKNWCAGPGYAQTQSYVFNFWQLRPLLWAWYCKHRSLKQTKSWLRVCTDQNTPQRLNHNTR